MWFEAFVAAALWQLLEEREKARMWTEKELRALAANSPSAAKQLTDAGILAAAMEESKDAPNLKPVAAKVSRTPRKLGAPAPEYLPPYNMNVENRILRQKLGIRRRLAVSGLDLMLNGLAKIEHKFKDKTS